MVRGSPVSDDGRGLKPCHALLNSLAGEGIDMEKITDQLEIEGVAKFSDAWSELLKSVQKELQK